MTIIYNGATYNLSAFLNITRFCLLPFLVIFFGCIVYDLIEKERLNKLYLFIFLLICHLQIALSQLTFN